MKIKRNTKGVIFSSVLAIFICKCNSTEKRIDHHLQEAHELINAGKFAPAEKALDNVLSLDSNNIEALILHGDIKTEKVDYINSIKDYKRAIKIDTNCVIAFFKIGLLYSLLEKNDSAVFFYNLAIDAKSVDSFVADYKVPNSIKKSYDVSLVEIMFSKALANYSKKAFKSAIMDFNFCISADYKTGDCYLYKGFIFLYNKNLNEACQDFEKAARYGNKDAEKYIEENCKGKM